MLKTIILSLALSSTLALAVERPQLGGATSGGGDLGLIRKANAARLLDEGRMKNRLREYLMRLEILDLGTEDPDVKPAFQKILPTINKDIDQSPYIFNGPCIDADGNAKAAATLNNIPGAAICFDPNELKKTDLSEATLVGLAIHEHARHLGVLDEDHALASYVVTDYEATKKMRAAEERGLTLDSRTQIFTAKLLCGERFYSSDTCPLFLEWNEKFRAPYLLSFGVSPEAIAMSLYSSIVKMNPGIEWADPRPASVRTVINRIEAAVCGPDAGFLRLVKAIDSSFRLPDGRKGK